MSSHSVRVSAVVFVDRRADRIARREIGDEALERGLDEMDAGRFERLEEARGKAQRNARS